MSDLAAMLSDVAAKLRTLNVRGEPCPRVSLPWSPETEAALLEMGAAQFPITNGDMHISVDEDCVGGCSFYTIRYVVATTEAPHA